MQKFCLSMFVLTTILIVNFGMVPVFGQVQNTLNVTTDRPCYSQSETILITGEVEYLDPGTPVSLVVKAPNGNIVSVHQVSVGGDKKFSTEITAGGGLMKTSGIYTVTTHYGNDNSSTITLEFDNCSKTSKNGSIPIEGSNDLLGYQITGGKLVSAVPDLDANSLIISVDATSDGSLTLTIPRSILDATMNGKDYNFYVLIDGEEVAFDETTSSTDRTITIEFPAGAEEIEIIGTNNFTPPLEKTSSISVWSDKASYNQGDTINISGKIINHKSGTPVSLVIKSSNGNIIATTQITPASDGTFSKSFSSLPSTSVGGNMKTSGTYTFDVQYGGASISDTGSFGYSIPETQISINSGSSYALLIVVGIGVIAAIGGVIIYSKKKKSNLTPHDSDTLESSSSSNNLGKSCNVCGTIIPEGKNVCPSCGDTYSV